MRSDRPRRPGVKARRAKKRAKADAAIALVRAKVRAPDTALRLSGRALVNAERLRPTNSYGIPDFVERGFYIDRPFGCKDCGKAEIWTATQQKWWYETAQGDVWTMATRCRLCRRRERDRRAEARRVHLEGLARKAQGKS